MAVVGIERDPGLDGLDLEAALGVATIPLLGDGEFRPTKTNLYSHRGRVVQSSGSNGYSTGSGCDQTILERSLATLRLADLSLFGVGE